MRAEPALPPTHGHVNMKCAAKRPCARRQRWQRQTFAFAAKTYADHVGVEEALWTTGIPGAGNGTWSLASILVISRGGGADVYARRRRAVHPDVHAIR